MKDQMVLVTVYDKNLKPHFVLCKTMEDAKRLYPGAEKRLISIKE
jgi:hypothetical protein